MSDEMLKRSVARAMGEYDEIHGTCQAQLAEAESRAEKAEADQRAFSDLAYACRESGAPCFCGCHVTHVCEPPPGWTPANGAARRVLAQLERAREAEARVAALEARLAEVGPVVEAAELWASEYAATGGDVSAVWAATHRKLAAAVAARSSKPAPDVHVAVSPEAVDEQLGRGSDEWKAAVSKALRMGKTMAEAWEIADLDAFNRGLDSAARSLRGAGEGGGA